MAVLGGNASELGIIICAREADFGAFSFSRRAQNEGLVPRAHDADRLEMIWHLITPRASVDQQVPR